MGVDYFHFVISFYELNILFLSLSYELCLNRRFQTAPVPPVEFASYPAWQS